ncbi:hypothetical protein LC1Hm_2037 [Halomicrobium sp. LC1Hm]|nr:hypothetical protein LC1Hm_2037 [Halomicrobium sp. LC1Hm]
MNSTPTNVGRRRFDAGRFPDQPRFAVACHRTPSGGIPRVRPPYPSPSPTPLCL